MHGIITFLKKSRISKIIIGIILPFPILLVALMLSPVEVFASEKVDDFTVSIDNVEVVYDNKPIWTAFEPLDNSYTNFRIGQAYTYIDVIYTIRFSSSSVLTPIDGTKALDGYAVLTEKFFLDVNPCNGDYPNSEYTGEAWCNTIKVESEGILDSKEGLSIANRSSNSIEVIPAAVRYGQGRKLTYNLNLKFDFSSFKNSMVFYNFRYRIRFKANFDNINITQTNLYQLVVFNRSNSSSVSNVYRNDYLGANIDKAASQAHSDSVAEKNAINSAASQAHSDQQAMQNIIQNDNSGFSSQQAQEKANIDAANQAADTAIDNSVHNYSAELQEVKDFNWSNFFTAQSSPASFWRDIGEYILDPSNLGFIATGLVVVTVITLFVFMLRL